METVRFDGDGKVARVRLGVTGVFLFVALIAGCAMRQPGHAPAPSVRPGIDVLLSDSIALIRAKRVGLLTNHTGIDARGVSDIERLGGPEARRAGARLVRLFSPEHGIRGTEDRDNPEAGRIDPRSGLAIVSLFTNQTIAPPDSTLRDLDVLVIDLQDIGTRTWTYVGAMVYALRSAGRLGLPVIVLDRPNPLSGLHPDGPVLDSSLANVDEPTPIRPGRAYALYPAPLRHGLTMGEMARFFVARLRLGTKLHVVPVAGWRREMWFDETGLPWVRPSPNLPALASATIYPALVAFEATNVSVGRGTPDAFQRIGAPWLPADRVVQQLSARGLPGVRFERSDFTPQGATDGKFSGRSIQGVRVIVTDRDRFSPGRTGAALVWAVARTAADSFVVRAPAFDDRFGRPAMREAILRGEDPDAVVARDSAAVAEWERAVAPFRLYR
ncbi:MAG TPA: DUF1343 domain-containing protein [Gemmatimonadaceae bacterium]|jgi:uncharacterized protein YbbC (DUF1343 family)|nr:DUF1343 domain-containing protein [Gemmatimonadaceae bacterium]